MIWKEQGRIDVASQGSMDLTVLKTDHLHLASRCLVHIILKVTFMSIRADFRITQSPR